MAGLILVLNTGSSTLKAALVETGDVLEAVASMTITWSDDRAEALERVIAGLAAKADLAADVDAVVHRVVHGGARFTRPVVIDDAVVDALDDLTELAPLHNGIAVEVIREARRRLPGVPHVACFDTAFHATLPEVAWRYAVPYDWTERWGIRRFGFHGLSVEWSVKKAAGTLGRPVGGTSVVVAHLGSGCSVTAVRDGESVWSSMGFTPLEGLMMGTRSGSIDPGILFYLLEPGRLTADALAEALERGSGLLGVSGAAADMQKVRSAVDDGDQRARLAVEMFVARAAQEIAGAMTWVVPDALVFTGGIGEHDARARDEIVARLPFATCPVITVEAREDLVMAEAAARLVGSTRTPE